MKTNFKKLFLLAIIFCIPNFVKAQSACSYSEQAKINDIVANVKATYEAVDIYEGKVLDIDNPDEKGNIPEIDNYSKGFKISVLNITDAIYVKVSNNINKDTHTYYYKDTVEGTANFQVKGVSNLVTYTIEIYSNKYSCVGEMFRKFTIVTPIYNSYSKMTACQENPGFYYCQEYISSENIDIDEFLTKVKDYKKEKEKEEQAEHENKSFWKKIKEFYERNAMIINISGIGTVLIIGGITSTILIKRKRSRVL